MIPDEARAIVDRMVQSPVNYWGVMVLDGVGAAALLVMGWTGFDRPLWLATLLVAAGLFTWTFLEYCLHRFIMHGPPSIARVGHAQHHASPTALISAPFFLVFLVAFGLWGLARLALPPGVAGLVVGGTYLGYNLYTWLHHVEHQMESVVSRVGYLRMAEQLHDLHHVQQNVNFGVSTVLWDRVFGTYVAASERPARASRARSNRSA